MVEVDDDLRRLRFRLVPKILEEEQFWRRYFRAVRVVRAGVLARGAAREQALEEGEEFGRHSARSGTPAQVPRASAAISAKGIRGLAAAVGQGRTVGSLSEMTARGAESGVRRLGFVESRAERMGGAVARALSASRQAIGQLTVRARSQLDPEEKGALYTLFDSEAPGALATGTPCSRLAEQLQGAPPAGFLACVTMIFAAMEQASSMALFWQHVVEEIRWHWTHRQPIPRVDYDRAHDITNCLIHQKLQLINCCSARLRRRVRLPPSPPPLLRGLCLCLCYCFYCCCCC